MNQKSKLKLSIIIPVYNEELSLSILHKNLSKTIKNIHCSSYEIIYVNDGSSDNSGEILNRLTKDKKIKVINFKRNYGQTSAISAGINYATGDILIFLDADLQNDPQDISLLLRKMNEGYDVVNGWRKNRQDPYFTKILPSIIANKILAKFLDIRIHDFGCTLKAVKKDYLHEIRLYGEMHRLLPFVAKQEGAKITEVIVKHHARRFGKSHYSLDRIIKILIDMMMLKLYYGYSYKPAYVFGSLGLGLFVLASLLSIFSLWERFYLGIYVHRNPIFLLSMFSFMACIQFILLGFLTEFIMRIYFETQNKPIYKIKQTINL